MQLLALSALNQIVLLGVNAVIAVVATWLLPVRRPAAFFACMLAISPLALALASPTTLTSWNIAGYVLNYLVIPCLFWKAPWARRAVCALVLVATEISSEMVFGILILFAGLSVNRDAVDATGIVARILCGVSMLTIGRAMAIAVRRAGWQGSAAGGCGRGARRAGNAKAAASDADAGASPNRLRSAAHPHQRDRRAARTPDRPYLLFLATQLGSLLVGSAVIMAHRNISPAPYLIMAALVAICLGADVLALASLRRLGAALRERERAEALERQLAVHADAARRTMREAEAEARFRHDQRNHLQVLGVLVERGERGRALAYARDLRRGIGEAPAVAEPAAATPGARDIATPDTRPSPTSSSSVADAPPPRPARPESRRGPRGAAGAPCPAASRTAPILEETP